MKNQIQKNLDFVKNHTNINLPNAEFFIESYSEPHRHYHNLNHLKECFELLETISNTHINSLQKSEIILSIFFHDIVYETIQAANYKDTNEKRSAQVFLKNIQLLNPQLLKEQKELIKRVCDNILLTEHHGSALRAVTETTGLFLDIDMSIMASEYHRFKEYDRQIKQEYSFIPQDYFNQKRIGFLNHLLLEKIPSLKACTSRQKSLLHLKILLKFYRNTKIHKSL